MEEYVLICEDSTEGILTGVYEAYPFKKKMEIAHHDNIHLATKEPDTQRLFTQYEHILTDHEKAEKVTNTIRKQLGNETWYRLSMAMVSCFEDKADAVYHTIVLGLKMYDRHITDRLQEDCVQRVFNYARASDNELCHLKQFLRFSELQNGMLYAKIDAKHHVLPFLMPHFADRLPADNFVIYDEGTQTFGLHASYKKWYLLQGQDFDEDSLVYSEVEETYQQLFKRFCDSIAIEARINPKLQMNMLPLRFRPNMTEFQ
ncbi:MAG: TIGR03915 family putative DNA repair protein [Lachnospiraceae bacterium]|nr:TIGR03915 family putative DNA repair protein [Lachnospiraceae bacterium]